MSVRSTLTWENGRVRRSLLVTNGSGGPKTYGSEWGCGSGTLLKKGSYTHSSNVPECVAFRPWWPQRGPRCWTRTPETCSTLPSNFGGRGFPPSEFAQTKPWNYEIFSVAKQQYWKYWRGILLLNLNWIIQNLILGMPATGTCKLTRNVWNSSSKDGTMYGNKK